MKRALLCFFALASCDGGRGTGGRDMDGVGVDMAKPPFDPNAACATATANAQVASRPVDIVWVIDNSSSMEPAITAVQQGLNAFSQLVASKMLDYRIVMLSLRSKSNPTMVGGDNRWGVCVPPPLAGGNDCENGPRFFHSSADIRSTQPLEQFLGTLGQTAGYAQGESRGGEPWQAFLRPAATKTIVVVTDDNSRFTASQFESFAGGKNPYNTSTLPAGILAASWNHLFDDYKFHGLYGWSSTTDPNAKCTFSGGTQPASSGPTYTALVQKTGGVRAKICDPPSSWTTFFDQVAQAVASGSKLACDVTIPTPPSGTLDPTAVNVTLATGTGSITIYKVANAAACGPFGGWFYDDDTNPTRLYLCPASCAEAQNQLAMPGGASLRVHFGCATAVQ